VTLIQSPTSLGTLTFSTVSEVLTKSANRTMKTQWSMLDLLQEVEQLQPQMCGVDTVRGSMPTRQPQWAQQVTVLFFCVSCATFMFSGGHMSGVI